MDRERLCVGWFQLRLTQEKGDLLGDDGFPPGVGEKLKGQAWEMGRTAGNPCTRGPISIMAQERHPWDLLGHPCCCTCPLNHGPLWSTNTQLILCPLASPLRFQVSGRIIN